MLDPRLTKLADVLVNYSIKAQAGERVLIEAYGIDPILVKELVKKVHAAGAYPFVNLRDHTVLRQLIMESTEAQMQAWADMDMYQMKQMDAYIGVRGGANINELSDVPADRMKLYNSIYYHPVHFQTR